jgi:hypothetical protein
MNGERIYNGNLVESNLMVLKKEMASNGHPVQTLEPDGEYHRYAIDGHKGQPGYYCIRANWQKI